MCEFANMKICKMRHKSVDTDSDLRLRMNEELTTNNVKNNIFA